eukprot:CAMPEP_0114413538 /NCGR_PEP_ID=MMETSP0103-20121206/910_1 /TAXON_ID=37642 ORGANISM="Paraphysomonas imperforata, Strain PA2" /NCGR_SAMPLE_ID=MMETSP0103 /ASSEMBLY_ACC=CAM_ASM_000201 /LENGTH=199 /DNA_ID=CAMNT_0001581623 /DNA_START=62 /DNA_END=658 /DNA_ORIENTATION=-
MENWSGREYPAIDLLEGRTCRLEAFTTEHVTSLYESTVMEGAEDRFRYLPEYSNPSREEFDSWFHAKMSSTDPKYYAIIDKSTGKVGGRQTFMSIRPEHGVAEIGHIHYSPLIARTTICTEGMFLMLQYLFDVLKYRRCEWKCNNANDASKRAAARFGFTAEGVFRQHLVIKGENRDTAWFSILDSEWDDKYRDAYLKW